jgi:hypothetical protein
LVVGGNDTKDRYFHGHQAQDASSLIPRNEQTAEVFVKQGPTCSAGHDQEEITWTLESKRVSTQGHHTLHLYHNDTRCDEVFGGQGHVVKPTAEEPVFEVKIAANKLFCLKRSSIKNFHFR